MSERKLKCSECGSSFATNQALGSHLKHKHGVKKDASSKTGLDLKNALVNLLHDVGIRKGAHTIAEIYLDGGGDSMEELDRILRLAGASSPARILVLKRWSQRVNQPVGETLLKNESPGQAGSSGVFEVYERIRESDLKELLMDDLRSRIEERRTKKEPASSGDSMILHLIDKLSDDVKELRLSEAISRTPTSWRMPSQAPRRRRRHSAYRCDNPYHSRSCVVCGSCGYHGSIARVPLGDYFRCPECGVEYFKDH